MLDVHRMNITKLFIDAGYESDLYSTKQLYIQRAHELLEFRIKYQRYPKKIRNNDNETKLAGWHSRMRQKHTNGKLTLEIINIMINGGFPYAFKLRATQYEYIKSFCDWYNEHKRIPNNNSNEREIFNIYQRIVKYYISDKINNTMKDIINEVFSDSNISNMEEILNLSKPCKRDKFSQVIKDIETFHKLHKRIPHLKGIIEGEQELYQQWKECSDIIIGYKKTKNKHLRRQTLAHFSMLNGNKEFMKQNIEFIEQQLDKAQLRFLSLSNNNKYNNLVLKCIDYCFYTQYPELYDHKEKTNLKRWYKNLIKSKEGYIASVEYHPIVEEIFDYLLCDYNHLLSYRQLRSRESIPLDIPQFTAVKVA